MEISWTKYMGTLSQRFVLQHFNCDTEKALTELLDEVYERTSKAIHAGSLDGAKPTVVFLRLIDERRYWDERKQDIIWTEVAGSCRRREGEVWIAVSNHMGYSLIHEFIHWLKPELNEAECKTITIELVRLWKWEVVSQPPKQPMGSSQSVGRGSPRGSSSPGP